MRKRVRILNYWFLCPALLFIAGGTQPGWCQGSSSAVFRSASVDTYEATLRVITACSADQFNTLASGRGVRVQDLQGVLQQQTLEAGKNVIGDSNWKNDIQAPYLAGQPITVRVYPRFYLTLQGSSLSGNGQRDILINDCSPALSYLTDPPNVAVPQPLLSAPPALDSILSSAPADMDLRYTYLKAQLENLLTPLAQWRYKQDNSVLIPYDDFASQKAFSLKSAPAVTQEWIRGLYACAQKAGRAPSDALPDWDSLGNVTITPKVILSVSYYYAPFNGMGGSGWGFEL